MNTASIRSLSKRYGRREVLREVDLELAPNELCVLLGANGAGKSTLLRSLIGLEPVVADEVEVLGFDPRRDPDEVRRRVGWMPDHSDVPPWMTPAECARFQAPCYAEWDERHVATLFERLQVPTRRAFAELSRGEAAKAMLALAQAHRPRFVILDEPLARLDPRTKDEVLACLLAEVPVEGGSCLLATHDLDVAARAADRVVLLANGRIDAVLDRDDIEAAHADRGGLRARLERLYDHAEAELSR